MKGTSQGFTLVEFLISLSLGLYLVTFTTALYLNLQKTIVFLQGLNQVETNACVALSALSRDIRMAGFIGPAGLSNIKTDKKQFLMPTDSLIGWHKGENSLRKPLPAQLSDINNDDVLLVQYAEPKGIPVIKARHHSIDCQQKLNFHPDRVLLIADCQHAEALQLSNIQLRHKYQEDASLSPLYCIIYYVAATGRRNKQQQPIYGLYRRDLNAPKAYPIELAEGIEKLEIRYGILSKASHLTYFTADAVDDWLQVRNVQLTLYLSSLENTQSPPVTHRPTQIAGQDKRLKRQWQQTVTIRARSTEQY